MNDTEDTLTLRMALPKGRLLDKTLGLMRAAGLELADDTTATRRLILDVSPQARPWLGCGLEILRIKNSDVPVYVQHGVADVGVVGTDALYEADAQVFKPYTFGFGGCKIALAARTDQPATLEDMLDRPVLRVATKYTRFAHDHFAQRGIPVSLIPLSGSVELAPVLGLSDVILDLVETGRTLRDNGLRVIEVVGHTHVKLIAHRALSMERAAALERLVSVLRRAEASLSSGDSGSASR